MFLIKVRKWLLIYVFPAYTYDWFVNDMDDPWLKSWPNINEHWWALINCSSAELKGCFLLSSGPKIFHSQPTVCSKESCVLLIVLRQGVILVAQRNLPHLLIITQFKLSYYLCVLQRFPPRTMRRPDRELWSVLESPAGLEPAGASARWTWQRREGPWRVLRRWWPASRRRGPISCNWWGGKGWRASVGATPPQARSSGCSAHPASQCERCSVRSPGPDWNTPLDLKRVVQERWLNPLCPRWVNLIVKCGLSVKNRFQWSSRLSFLSEHLLCSFSAVIQAVSIQSLCARVKCRHFC